MRQEDARRMALSHMQFTVKDIGKAIIGYGRGIGDDALGHFLIEHPRTATADAMREFFQVECYSDMEVFARQYASRRFALETVEQTFVMSRDVCAYRAVCNRMLNQLYKGR